MTLTSETTESLNELFKNPDLSIVKELIYFDSWVSYEEFGGIVIFKGIDDSIQMVDFGYCVMAEDNGNYFTPNEVDLAQALDSMNEMISAILNSDPLI
jgi:hypothetical protein